MRSIKLTEPFGSEGESPMRQSPLSRKNYAAVGYKSKSHEKRRKSPAFSSFSQRNSVEPTAASTSFTHLRSGQGSSSREEAAGTQVSGSSAARSARQLTGSDSASESPCSARCDKSKRIKRSKENENRISADDEVAKMTGEAAATFSRTQEQVLQEIQPL